MFTITYSSASSAQTQGLECFLLQSHFCEFSEHEVPIVQTQK